MHHILQDFLVIDINNYSILVKLRSILKTECIKNHEFVLKKYCSTYNI